MRDSRSPLLDPHDLAAALGICTSTLRARWRRGVIPRPLRLGHRRYWFRDEVQHLPGFSDERGDRVTGPRLAAMLGVGITHVYHLIAGGYLPAPDHGVESHRASWSIRAVVSHLKKLPRG